MKFGVKTKPTKCSRCMRTKDEAIKEQKAKSAICTDEKCTFKREITIEVFPKPKTIIRPNPSYPVPPTKHSKSSFPTWVGFVILLLVAVIISLVINRSSTGNNQNSNTSVRDSVTTAVAAQHQSSSGNNTSASNSSSYPQPKLDSAMQAPDNIAATDDDDMTARQVVEKFFNLLSNGDYNAAWQLSDNPGWNEQGGYNYFVSGIFGTNLKPVNDWFISGDNNTATIGVSYYMTINDSEQYHHEKVILQKEYSSSDNANRWKIIRIRFANE